MIEAIYFDGKTSRPQPVTLVIHQRVLAIRGANLHRSVRLSQLSISERLQHAPRLLRFPQGGVLEVSDPALDRLLAANRFTDPRVVRWQQNWHLSLLALIVLLAVLLSGYQWGLPWSADKIAQHLPHSLEMKIGDEQLKMIDARYLAPSKLDPVDQARLQRLFAAMKQPRAEKTPYRLEFRHSKIGPNAFALPNGVIIMTDQLVMRTRSDEAVLGVLAHELGHLQRRHSLRRVLQALGVGVVVNLFVGDVSSVLVAAPTFLLDQKYSRDFEREADRYAIDMLQANRVSLLPMAEFFEKMKSQHAADDADDADSHVAKQDSAPADASKPPASPLEYFSSHPSNDERIARLRAAAAAQ